MWTSRLRTRRKWHHPPSGSGGTLPESRTRSRINFAWSILAMLLVTATRKIESAECPPAETIPGCPCYNFEDGLFLECAGATEESLKVALLGVLITSGGEGAVVQSLSVYELDRNVEELREVAFPIGTQIRHLQISHSRIKEISENAFERLGQSLESLALVSGRLPHVPQKALAPLLRLTVLDLEGNLVHDLPSYSFYGLSLIKLNVKGNQIAKISEYAFTGLEDTLTDLDLAENKIRVFPMTGLRRLERLTSLRLAWNEISELPEDGYSKLKALNFLDLSSNNFEVITLNCFRCCPSLRTLSLYYNAVESVDKDAFISLSFLESIDLSHNKIVFLDISTFRANQRLRSIDLSHNHIHYIRGVFSKLPDLKELFLAENNILEIPPEAFAGSTSLSVVYLQQNAIRRIDPQGLATLNQLAQLHLSGNYIEKIPRDFLGHCENLSTLSLDGNNIRELEVGTFAKVKQLRELRLQDNQITEVKRDVFTPLPSLLELHLQNNAITDMETGALRSLHSLQHVNLQGNLLAVLGDVFQVSNDVSQNGNGGSSLVSIQLDNNGLGVLHNDSLRGQASVRIMWLGHNRLTRLQAPLFRDLLLVERLYLTNNSISRIEDAAFQPMQALKFLELSMNRLSHVTVKTFSELHELEELYLQDNGLRRLDPYSLTALKRLRVLDLANNHLNVLHDTIFQEGLPIRTLNLRNCTVSVIERGAFRGLNNLYELNLEHNHLTAAALDRLDIPGLRVLRVSHNNFSQINGESLDGLPSLQQLTMDSVQLHRIPPEIFSKNKNLGKLMLSNNILRSLPGLLLIGLESLKEVKLDGNRFQDIPYDAFANATSIEILSLAKNVILNVDVSKLNGMTNLRELDLRGNYISSLYGFAAANLSRLNAVDLSHNRLTALPANFFIRSHSLRRVDLAVNNFRQIPGVALSSQNIPGLSWLNMTANPLMRIHEISSEAKYPALQEIHISATNLTIVTSQDFEAFPALMHLFMGNNVISRVSPSAFRNLPNLLTLDMSSNELELLPQERLRRLEHLKLLNLTHNKLKELENFPPDLKALQILDLSHNQISGVGKNTFQHLEKLEELHLYGNWISFISPDAFRPLKKLRILDLSKNYLENLPLNAFRPLETQIRSLRAEENPLNCGCESQELWEWLRDHQKLVGGVGRNRGGMGVNEMESGLLRCEKPPELRGQVFLDLDPHAFCSAPLIPKLAIQDIQPFSVLVSWQSRNHSRLQGYQVAYHAMDNVDEVRGKVLEPSARSVKLPKLFSNTRYRICVFGLGNWGDLEEQRNMIGQFNASHGDIFEMMMLPEMIDSRTSRCTEVKTLEAVETEITSIGSVGEVEGVTSILTRRLGLIVGCCMGFIVFIVLVSVLGYLKVKKQREAVKRDQQAIPSECISYRHFSIQSGEAGHGARVTNQDSQQQHPSFITNVGNTSLNV
ncbi:protein artichoke isoform X1 [Neodiprion lecontei]|uniref:Protein artichoke isoform X1 n=1 Tax=Neodiprion lecontei TaxID=441921 RepID=A0ABM3FXX1_NEOLC|nr:protein artichoke isoform X1 [Neodiprion lecontei]XP_046592858.1 protein artichoke isoform X1 [Neodiprion lecontei]XP_046592859.1 protein artichoke isoform X1 [Neodiprion lecontei]XP_046592860.1 protein artichoke isoform X1 [Neodiprion lecontei]XP_046592861.1 protein artichoke isoform X1 [Neodiprion lecontei]